MFKILKSIKIVLIVSLIFTITSCSKGFFKPGDARKNPPDPKLRVKKNLEEGKGFRLNSALGGNSGGTNFEFASSNELWRASLDVLDFMPLTSANYSGGVIITDWYSEQGNAEDSIKITTFARQGLKELRVNKRIIEPFYFCDTLYNCSKHIMVPQHIICTPSEKREVRKLYGGEEQISKTLPNP